jgi:hypothetical protein
VRLLVSIHSTSLLPSLAPGIEDGKRPTITNPLRARMDYCRKASYTRFCQLNDSLTIRRDKVRTNLRNSMGLERLERLDQRGRSGFRRPFTRESSIIDHRASIASGPLSLNQVSFRTSLRYKPLRYVTKVAVAEKPGFWNQQVSLAA